MELELRVESPIGVGPLLIGMSESESDAAIRRIPGYIPAGPGSATKPGFADFTSGMNITFEFDATRMIKAIEIYRPECGANVVIWGIDVFLTRADDVIRRLSAETEVRVEDDGRFVVAPRLLVALWRPTLPDGPRDEDGAYFDSVLVAGPGYYD